MRAGRALKRSRSEAELEQRGGGARAPPHAFTVASPTGKPRGAGEALHRRSTSRVRARGIASATTSSGAPKSARS